MEYDRALYRVYERVLEDLSLSAPIVEWRHRHQQQESSQSESSNRRVGGTSLVNSDLSLNGNININANTNTNANANANANANVNESENENANANTDENENGDTVENGVRGNQSGFNNPTTAAFTSGIRMRNGRSELRTVPFILPLFMHPYSDALMEALSNEGSWRRFWDTVRYHHHHSYYDHNHTNNSTENNSDGHAYTNTNNRISDILTWISSLRGPGTVGPGHSFSRLDLRDEQTIFRNIEHHYDAEDSNAATRLPSFDANADGDGDGESVDVEPALEMTTINSSSSGLRRRPAMRIAMAAANSFPENGDRERNTFLGTSSSSSSGSSTNGLSRIDHNSSSFDSTDPATTPTTRMAQQIASAHVRETNNEALQRPATHIQDNNDSNNNNNMDHANGVREGCTQKGIFNFMRVTMIIGIGHLVILFILHTTYVGATISKPSVLTHTNTSTTYRGIDSSQRTLLSQEKEDHSDNSQTLISMTCLEYALATRTPQKRSQYFRISDDDDDNHTDETNNDSSVGHSGQENVDRDYLNRQTNSTHNVTSSDAVQEPPLLSQNEILQIIILYGGKCIGHCSRVHEVRHYPISNETNDRHTHEETFMSSSQFWEAKNVHFKYASNEALMHLENKMLRWYNVSLVNVTLTERCLNTGSDHGHYPSIKAQFAQVLSKIYGMNAIIINQLMYGIKAADGKFQDGHVQNVASEERWSWSGKLMNTERKMRSNALTWLSHKISVVIASVLAFFLVTSVTAVTVRVLTSSGVVIMFPIFALFRHFGLNGADDRILGFSYPWIGRARRAIHRERLHPQSHFLFAHLAKLFLFYIMYEACQSTWSSVLYRRSIPANLPLWLFGYAMVWEYFSMIFVRSALSAYFFPRVTMLYFMCYHIYFYSVPYGFFDIALIPWFLFMLHAMCFTVISLEVPGSARGAISLECPREVYSRLSWPEWSASLPDEFTLFLPLNSRYVPLHDRPLGEDVDNENESEHEEVESVGAEIDIQDANQNETTNVSEGLMLPLGHDDSSTD